MRIDLRPPIEAAGISIGAVRSEAHRHCHVLGETSEFHRGDEANPSLAVERPSGLAIFVYFDKSDTIDAIELGRPSSGEDSVVFRGLDVFGTPADELVRQLGEQERIEVSEAGRSLTAPDLLLALWRPVVPVGSDDEEGRHFESALIARPGYYG